MQRIHRRGLSPDPKKNAPLGGRGLFGGSMTVRFGLLAFLFCLLIVTFFRPEAITPLKGPIDDIFLKKAGELAIIYGTGDEDGPILEPYARRVSELLGKKLSVEIPVYADTEVSGSVLKKRSLILYGPVGNNRVARNMSASFPFAFSGSHLARSRGEATVRDPWRLIFIIPNPYDIQRYVLIYTAGRAEDVVGINILDHPNFLRGDKTDYVLAAGAVVLEQGYFDKQDSTAWRLADD
ncbi:MAG: hypothetical protein U9P14_05240 [Gemmatimonadota bacterium]|nr:hypothetical protein [Gemmatimonadota bacterium]